ncbi:hypothetical protein ACVIDN_006068 [Rhizobium brockwellii]
MIFSTTPQVEYVIYDESSCYLVHIWRLNSDLNPS